MDFNKQNSLSLFRGKSLKFSESISFKHPTLSEIEELGEDRYNQLVSCLCTSSIDIADILWFDMKIWYEDIKDEWEFFIQRCVSNQKSLTIKNVEYNIIENECMVIDSTYRDALNYFLGTEGEYIVLEINSGNTTQKVLCNVIPYVKNNNIIYYTFDKNSFKFTKTFYESSKSFLDKINWMKRNYDYLKGGTKGAKKYILKNTLYKERKREKKKEPNVTLESIVSSLVAKGTSFCDIWDMPIYSIYDLYYRHIKIDDYKNTVSALYNGCIDTKKNPINWEKINWANVIK